MPAAAVWVLLATGVIVAVTGRARHATVVLAATWLLVPGSARVPGADDGQLLLHRVVLLAVLVGLVRALLLGRLHPRTFAVRGVHAAFGIHLVVAALIGLALARPGVAASLGTNAFLELVEQAVFFVACLALFRAVGPRWTAAVVTATAAVGALIGLVERQTGWSYSRWFARDLADPTGLLSADLATRGPHERIRVAGAFALEYGWVTALLVPLALAVALGTSGRWRPVAWAAPGLLVAGVISTWSRTAYAGLAVGLGVLALGVVLDRPQRTVPLGIGGLVFGGVLLQGPLQRTLEVGGGGGDRDVRLARLPDVLGLVADRPLLGSGLGGLLDRRISVVDVGWVTTYATIGLLGVITLAALLLAAAHAGSRFVLSAPSPTRTVAAAATATVVAAPLALASYDFGTLRMSTETLWAMAALAIAAGERLQLLPVPVVRRDYRVPVAAAVLGVLGLVGGVCLALAVPARHSIDVVFSVSDPAVVASTPSDQAYTTKVLSQTACMVIDEIDLAATARCLDLDQVAGGTGTVRLEAANRSAVEAAHEALVQRLRHVFPAATVTVAERGRGRPTWASTAPVWMAAAGFAIGATAPDRRRRPAVSGPPGGRPALAAGAPARTRPPRPAPRPGG